MTEAENTNGALKIDRKLFNIFNKIIQHELIRLINMSGVDVGAERPPKCPYIWVSVLKTEWQMV